MTNKSTYENQIDSLAEEEQDLFNRRSARLSKYMNLAIEAKNKMQVATNDAFDAGSEFGFEMGALSKESDILAKINEIFSTLTDEEEDAKLTLEIIKRVIFRLDNENDE